MRLLSTPSTTSVLLIPALLITISSVFKISASWRFFASSLLIAYLLRSLIVRSSKVKYSTGVVLLLASLITVTAGCGPSSQSNTSLNKIEQPEIQLRDDRGNNTALSDSSPFEELEALFSISPYIMEVFSNGKVIKKQLDSGRSQLLGKVPVPFTAVTVDPISGFLAYGNAEKVEILNLSDMKTRFTLKKIHSKVLSLDFHPAGEILLIGGADGKVYQWKFRQAEEATTRKDLETSLERYVGHPSSVKVVKYHPYGRLFFSGDWNGFLNAWLPYEEDKIAARPATPLFRGSIFTEKSVRVSGTRVGDDEISHLIPSLDGEHLLVGTTNGRVQVWKTRGFRSLGEVATTHGLLYDLVINPKGGSFASCGRDGTTQIWKFEDAPDGSPKVVFKQLSSVNIPGAKKLNYTNNGKLIAAKNDGTLQEVGMSITKEVQ